MKHVKFSGVGVSEGGQSNAYIHGRTRRIAFPYTNYEAR